MTAKRPSGHGALAGSSALPLRLSLPFRIAITSAIAARGDGGSCGQHQTMSGRYTRIQAAVMRAFFDWGDERKPCR